jgi:hypothetical protein
MDEDRPKDSRRRKPTESHLQEGSERHTRKATDDDPESLARIVTGSSYQLVERDVDFLSRNDLRGVRLLLEYLKPELLMAEHNISSRYRCVWRHAYL